MFSSNQVLEMSGDLDQIKSALQFALDYAGESKNMTEEEYKRGCRLTYQISKDKKKYCIGWAFLDNEFDKLPRGWNEYPFRFSIDIVTPIIKQHLEQFSKETCDLDGSFEKGFLMKVIPEGLPYDDDSIEEEFYGIVSFEPFTCYYSK